MNHLQLLDGRWVSGASVPGIPFVFMGRNRDIAWGLTPSAVRSDAEDLFMYMDEQKIVHNSNGAGDSDVRSGGIDHNDVKEDDVRRQESFFSCATSDDCQERHEEINVRDEQDPERLLLVDTGHGPVIDHLLRFELQSLLHRPRYHDHPHAHRISIALSSQALKQPINLKFLQYINFATSSFLDFQAAADHLHHIHAIALFSDVDGNIGSTITGKMRSASICFVLIDDAYE